MPVDSSLLPQIVAEAKKRYGGVEVIHSGDTTQPVYRIPWDSLELNLATYGGAPMGRMIRCWGGPSSCKTLQALLMARNAQQHRSERFPDGLTVAYYNIEGTYDPVFTRNVLGLDIAEPKFMVVEGQIIEEISRSLDALLHAINIHIIDSTSFAQSTHIADAKKESNQPGFDAKAWRRALQSAEQNMDKQENMVIYISHDTVDFHTGALKAQGGRTLDFASSMTLKHRQAKKLYRRPDGTLGETRPKEGNDDLTGSHRVDGYELEIEVIKSKVCRPFGKARLIYDIANSSFDKSFELFKAGVFLGVIQKSGSHYSIPTSDKSIHGEPKMKARLMEDDALVMAIFSAANDYISENAYAANFDNPFMAAA